MSQATTQAAALHDCRQAFAETHDIASAVSIARARGEGPSSPARLQSALTTFSEDAADRLLEESLAVRSVERTVDSVLLPAVELLRDGSPERAFAWRYATGWLAAATRVAPPASRDESALIFDARAPALWTRCTSRRSSCSCAAPACAS